MQASELGLRDSVTSEELERPTWQIFVDQLNNYGEQQVDYAIVPQEIETIQAVIRQAQSIGGLLATLQIKKDF